MHRVKSGLLALGVIALFGPGNVPATTRDIAELETAPLTLRQSVISELSGGLLQDPFDEFLMRPYNLSFVNLERHGNLSPWPGQEGEQDRYVNALIGNNGNTNVRNGADALQGTYIRQSMEKFTWGAAVAYLADDVQNSDAAGTLSFADGAELVGFDLRFGASYRISDRIRIGGGVSLFDQSDEATDSSFEQGVGGFFSLQELTRSGIEADFGLRRFQSDSSSWEAQLTVGVGETDLNDFSEDLDDTGAVISRFVVTEYALTDSYVELSGGYNRRYTDHLGELQLRAGYRMAEHELDNTDLAYADVGGIVTPSLALVNQDPVTEDELFASAGTLFLRGWTQMFAGARLSLAQVDGSTQVDSLGTIVTESIDDSATRLNLILGLRQPLWNEKFRLIASAQADWIDQGLETTIDTNSSGTDFTKTMTSYAIGVETVLSNMTFDLAWLFGEAPAPGGTTSASRQTIDFDRVVISATLGW